MSNSHVSVRLSNERIARVDALIPRFSTEWVTVTRSDVMRALLEYALVRFEGEADQKRGDEEGRTCDVRSALGSGAEEEKAR